MAATIILALAVAVSTAILWRPARCGGNGNKNSNNSNSGDNNGGLALGAAAGILGAVASTCGKVALQPGAVAATRGASFSACAWPAAADAAWTCAWWPALALRGAAALGLAAANAGMLACFVRALRRAGALRATVCSSAGGLAASGALGALAFGEALGAAWWGGAVLMAAGVAVLAGDQDHHDD